ncbi:hypothetical protein D3C78_976380 [compost metagenome]
MSRRNVGQRGIACTVAVQHTAAVDLLQRTLELIVPLRRVHRHRCGICQALFLRPSADRFIAERVQGWRRNGVADATRIGGGIGVADVIGEVCRDVATGLNDGAIDRTNNTFCGSISEFVI